MTQTDVNDTAAVTASRDRRAPGAAQAEAVRRGPGQRECAAGPRARSARRAAVRGHCAAESGPGSRGAADACDSRDATIPASAACTRNAATALSPCARRLRRLQAFEQAVTVSTTPCRPAGACSRVCNRMTGQAASATAAANQVATLRKLPPAVVAATALFLDGDLDLAEPMVRTYPAGARQ